MPDTDWNLMTKRALKYALMKGYRQEADDFAQYFTIKKFLKAKGTMAQLWVDYLRHIYGVKRKDDSKNTGRVPTKIHPRFMTTVRDRHLVLVPREERSLIFYKKFLSQEEQFIFHKYIIGYSLKEIGSFLKVTESLICLKIKKITTRLRTLG